MKKVFCLILVLCILSGAVPVVADNPYEIVSEFSDEDLTGVIVKKGENYNKDFTLYATYTDGEYVYDVKCLKSSRLLTGREISFDTVDGAEIRLFAWDEAMRPAGEDFSDLDYSTVMSQLKKANDYWIGQNKNVKTASNPWQVAVFHTGNMQAYYMTGDELYRNYSQSWANAHLWQSYGYPTGDQTNADNICCFRTYLDLYNMGTENANIDYVKNQVDTIADSSRKNFWNWIDAFYMAGPIFTKMYELTGDEKYLDKMYEMIKYTAENLNCYDEEVGLWFRDASFIDDVSENGKKIYWSRGDGWVYAAFAQIIEELPDSYEHKDYFVDIFLQMSAALKKAQCKDGAWHESLLDPDYNPTCEESGTGFFVYGMLWGINNGYLDESEYFIPAARGWKWLSEVALQESGLVGYVQHIGAYPTKYTLTATSTQHYAYANFVFAASEMAKYLGGMQGDVVPYLQKKLLGNIEVYKKNAPYAIKNGSLVESDINCEELIVPEGMYLYKYDDLYVISEFITPFNKTEDRLLDVLGDVLTNGKFPERPYTNPDRITITGGENAFVPEVSEKDRIIITVEEIAVSQIPEEANIPANMIDGNTATRWAAEVTDKNDPCWAIFDLGDVYELDKMGLSFYRDSTRQTEFAVEISVDGKDYTTAIARRYSPGETEEVEYYLLNGVEARYVKLIGYGNTSPYSNIMYWFSPTEVEFYKVGEGGVTEPEEEPSDEPSEDVTEPEENYDDVKFDMTQAMLKASIETEPQNNAEKLRDGDFNSYCVLYVPDETKPEYIEIDLGDVYSLSRLGLAFRWATTRTFDFDVRVSKNGESFTTVVPRRTSGQDTEEFQYFGINENARYIRVYGYSNSYNKYWISITEAEVYINE
ncbi:MAG: glycoside hydrolase family 88 protein [Clostridia bacterium]|nr:glycoside hydrolase family 88 protein [Clostridia bacterium]